MWEPPKSQREPIPPKYLEYYESGFECACDDTDCSGPQGACLNGQCICEEQFVGAACEHTRCRSPECFGNDNCHDPAFGSLINDCNGQGHCVAGECVCDAGFTSESNCIRRGCPGDGTCSGRPAAAPLPLCAALNRLSALPCRSCAPQYHLLTCAYPPASCLGHGTCDEDEGVCVCDSGYSGEDCHLDTCEENFARLPGLYVEYFNTYNFQQRTMAQVRPAVSRGSTSLLAPGVSRDYNSLIYSYVSQC